MPEISEEWILEQLQSGKPETDELIAAIDSAAAEDRERDALSWAQLAEETFADRGDFRTALAAMRRRAAIGKDGPGKNAEYAKAATELLKHDRDMRRLVEDAGFDKKLAPAECVRRLLVLLALAPGTICYDSTWGQGVVKEVDMFYHRVEIDFERKRGHQLSLAYAGETLELLAPDHLLALNQTDPEKLQQMAAEEQGELVKLAVNSMGSMTADELKDELVPRIISEKSWKGFWAGARKTLKKDPLFDLPAKRSEPMRVLEDEAELHGSIWFEQIGDLRKMDEIVAKLELCIASVEEIPADDEILDIVANRLGFVITGSLSKQPELAARALLLAEAFRLPDRYFDAKSTYQQFLSPALLKNATDRLTAKYLKPFVRNLLLHNESGASDAIIGDLSNFSHSVLTEILDLLIEMDYGERIAVEFRDEINRRTINAKMLLWVLRNEEFAAKWRLGTNADLVPIVFRILENEQTNDDTTDYKRLRTHCEKGAWLKKVCDDMTPLQRKEFTMRVMQSGAWSSLDRKSMLARLIKIDPEMQKVVTPTKESSQSASTAAKTTSIRSYNARIRHLERITNSEIPENSREIAEARSHGDLRENAEFKAAKERQGLLMRRQGQLERDLRVVEATDFSDAYSGVVGPGTMVTIVYADSSSIQYTILGEWDRDEELNIISSNSRLARVLRGRKAGETVVIPSENGEDEVVLAKVEPLDGAMLDWVKSEG